MLAARAGNAPIPERNASATGAGTGVGAAGEAGARGLGTEGRPRGSGTVARGASQKRRHAGAARGRPGWPPILTCRAGVPPPSRALRFPRWSCRGPRRRQR
jgi:hypothetical protein